TAFVGFSVRGHATMAGHPDLPVSGGRVRVLDHDSGRLLCDVATLSTGAYGCSFADQESKFAPSMTWDLRFTGRGPEVDASIAVTRPATGGSLAITHDFEALNASAIELTGVVVEPDKTPSSGALVLLTGPVSGAAHAGEDGRYRMVIALPDGYTNGTLVLQAYGRGSQAALSVPFETDGLPELHLAGNFELALSPGSLPPTERLRKVLFTGTVTNALVTAARGLSVPVPGVSPGVTSAAFVNHDCDAAQVLPDGTWQCVAILLDDAPFDALASAGPYASSQTLHFEQNDVPAPGQLILQRVELTASPTTLEITGLIDTAARAVPGASALLTATGSGDPISVSAIAQADGTYRAFLAFPTVDAVAGTLTGQFSLPGAETEPLARVNTSTAFSAFAGTLTTVTQDARFTRGTAVLSGQVVDALIGDAPIAGATVTVLTGGETLCQTRTDDHGLYACTASPAGTSTVALTYVVSGIGAGTFTSFGGQPALLDLSLLTPGLIVPILPTRDLPVNPSTLRVTGTLTDKTGRAVPGAWVGLTAAGGAAQPTVSDDAGHYQLDLALAEGLTGGELTLSAHLPLGGGTSQATLRRVFSLPAHTLLTLDLPLALVDEVPAGPVAWLAFSGTVNNQVAPGSGVAGALVTAALDGSGRTLCTATTDSAGRYTCESLLRDAPSSPQTFRWTVALDGTALAPPLTASRTYVRSTSTKSPIAQDLSASPTTLRVHGRLTDTGGQPLPQAAVSLTGTLRGQALTDAQGDYELVVTARPGLTRATGALTAVANGLTTSAPVDVALTPAALTDLALDLSLSERGIVFSGAVRNPNAAGAPLQSATITLRRAGRTFCAVELAAISSSDTAYTCPELVLASDADQAIEWTVTNLFGTNTGTLTLASADIPAVGTHAQRTLDLTLPASALGVLVTVRNSSQQTVQGASVSVAVGDLTASALTGSDGTAMLFLSLPDSLPPYGNGSELATMLLTARLGTNLATLQQGVPITPAQLTQLDRTIDFSDVTRVAFAGAVKNLNAHATGPGSFVQGAKVQLVRDGFTPPLGVLCDAVATTGTYGCGPITLFGEALSSLSLHAVTTLEGTSIADAQAATFAVTPGAGITNALSLDVDTTPTTVRLSGNVRDPLGTPLVGATVSTPKTAQVPALTAIDGSYALDVPLPTGVTTWGETITAQLQGNQATAPGAAADLVQRAPNAVTADLTLSERRVRILGRVENALAPETPFAGAHLVLTRSATVVCDRTTDATLGYNFAACPDLVLTSGAPVELTWAVDGPWGTGSGTLTLGSGDIPAAGGISTKAVSFDLAASTLEVTGRVTENGVTLSSGTAQLRNNDPSAVASGTTLGTDGSFGLRLSFPAAATSYDVNLQGSDGVNSAQLRLQGALSAGALVSVVQDLDITVLTPGSARWSVTVGNGTAFAAKTPALAPDGSVLMPRDNVLWAIDPDTGAPRWYFVADAGIRSGVMVDGNGIIYIGDASDWLYALSPAGEQLWKVAGTEAGRGVTCLALGDTLVYAGQATRFSAHTAFARIRAHDRVDGHLVLEASLGTNDPSELSIASDGGMLVSTTGGWLMLSPDGTPRITGGGLINGPLIPLADGGVLAPEQYELVRFDLNGNRLWGYSRPVASRGSSNSPAVDADGSILMVAGKTLVRLSPDGEELAAVDVAAGATETLNTSGPTIGADGTVYVTSNTTGGAGVAVYAVDRTFAPLWSHLFPAGAGGLSGVTLANGAAFVTDGKVLRNLLTESPGLAASDWPKYKRDAGNTAQGAPAPQHRTLVVTGHAGDTSCGPLCPVPLQFGSVVFTLDGKPGCTARTDASGDYHCSIFVPADTFTLEGTLLWAGYEATTSTVLAAGTDDAQLTWDLDLAATTLIVSGTVRDSAGAPLPDADVYFAAGDAYQINDAFTDASGAYRMAVLFGADVAGGPDSMALDAWLDGAGGQRRRVSFDLVQGDVAFASLDFTLADRQESWEVRANLGWERTDLAVHPQTGAPIVSATLCDGDCFTQVQLFYPAATTETDPTTQSGDYLEF
ncbi:MAG: PQQ-binding-like beta-propeller repeat protein, partial [Deltaproteobacteria bacterium]|nr:PQQ-binding-like beta-propeller repeat protein [Deltaproteobacteria bacterium]